MFRKAKIRIKILAHSFFFINHIPPIIFGTMKRNNTEKMEIATALSIMEASTSISGINEIPKNKRKKKRAIRKFNAP
jgi:hypothetical protein